MWRTMLRLLVLWTFLHIARTTLCGWLDVSSDWTVSYFCAEMECMLPAGVDVVGLCGAARGAQQQGGGGESNKVEKASDSAVERHLYIFTVLRYEQKTDANSSG